MKIAQQLQLKLDLERQFLREVKTLFNRMKTDFRIGVAIGRRIRASVYRAAWENALITHYKRAQRAFLGAIDDPQKQDDQTEQDINDELLLALLLWVEKNAPHQADIITYSNQQSMDMSLDQARQALSDDGITDYSNRELATVAAAILGRKLLGRTQSIVTTETQGAAESTKFIEAYSKSGLSPEAAVTGAIVVTQSKKMWLSQRDERVRTWHAAADGQWRPLNRPFIVGGEHLMYPRDWTLGASPENIMNCRCFVIYEIR